VVDLDTFPGWRGDFTICLKQMLVKDLRLRSKVWCKNEQAHLLQLEEILGQE